MKYVVTGGAGFIGSHIVEELVKKGEDVVVIDNLSAGTNNLPDLPKDILEKIKFIKGDICDLNLLKEEFQDVDFVLHHAALISVRESVEKKDEYTAVIHEGTRNILEAARLNNVKRVVFASSCAVYGNTNIIPQTEQLETNPLSPYAELKLSAEKLCNEYYKKHGLKTIILRYFNVFGPRQSPDSTYAGVIPLFIKKVLNNETPNIYGDGEQTRDFVFVKDIVNVNLLACKANAGFGEPINIGTGQETSVNKILFLINKHLNKNVKPNFAPEKKEELKRACSDNTKAEKLLGFKAKYGFEQGLKETIEWIKTLD
ncbi:MAG: NAD-dependent epimerase/dehydratase family protein [Nanoarchaeota archaeon]|nr:NAD-dependent epimerase/dehydratase family protein [Nanoarchaeota archaeon]MBU1321090.1 NAD-dependent epimerase/dehydratase family protein [Nanoarchaeota archaeon]MBU1596953.1 NAD-dependent epimerase/dehydratase family protein [Nanoarchaeota archaeon]MBU2441252.1 NAD-dependent epimerase/dehydratase family protein [Nanoarchaeota archaeon]